jgi:hypothetical protein
MRRDRFRMKLRTVLFVVAASAVVFSFAGSATRRWSFCWRQQAMFARFERQMLAIAARPNNRVVHAGEAAIAYGHRKWRYRWEAFRFWEPYELIES